MSIYEELVKGMMIVDFPSDYWLTAFFGFKELEESKKLIQRNGQSVYKHTMAVMDALETKNTITLLSGLFHDLGKFYVDAKADTFGSRFPNHEQESDRIARERLTEWGASSSIIDSVCRIVRMHMFDLLGATREKTIRKFVASVGRDNIDDWFVLRVADSKSYADPGRYRNHFIEPFREKVMSYLEKQPQSGSPLIEQPDGTGTMQIRGSD